MVVVGAKTSPAEEVGEVPQVQRGPVPQRSPSNLLRRASGQRVPPGGSDEHVLVVNGKARSIGKKSQYLLDMLTLDDE